MNRRKFSDLGQRQAEALALSIKRTAEEFCEEWRIQPCDKEEALSWNNVVGYWKISEKYYPKH